MDLGTAKISSWFIAMTSAAQAAPAPIRYEVLNLPLGIPEVALGPALVGRLGALPGPQTAGEERKELLAPWCGHHLRLTRDYLVEVPSQCVVAGTGRAHDAQVVGV